MANPMSAFDPAGPLSPTDMLPLLQPDAESHSGWGNRIVPLSVLRASLGDGNGDVTGPSSSIADRIAVFHGTSGKQIKDGGYTIAQLRSLALTSPENVQTGTAYTLVLADAFKLVAMDNIAANTLFVPPNSAVPFPVYTRIDLSQDGAGQTTIAAGSGVTIRTPETLKIRKRYGKATLIKRDTNTWDLEGNLEAAP